MSYHIRPQVSGQMLPPPSPGLPQSQQAQRQATGSTNPSPSHLIRHDSVQQQLLQQHQAIVDGDESETSPTEGMSVDYVCC